TATTVATLTRSASKAPPPTSVSQAMRADQERRGGWRSTGASSGSRARNMTGSLERRDEAADILGDFVGCTQKTADGGDPSGAGGDAIRRGVRCDAAQGHHPRHAFGPTRQSGRAEGAFPARGRMARREDGGDARVVGAGFDGPRRTVAGAAEDERGPSSTHRTKLGLVGIAPELQPTQAFFVDEASRFGRVGEVARQ